MQAQLKGEKPVDWLVIRLIDGTTKSIYFEISEFFGKIDMDKIVIEGGVPLNGEVSISGAKNAALPIIAATLLAPGVHQLYNVPPLADIRTAKKLLGLMGVTV